ncbi:MAG TPA: YeiH family protein [Rhodoferax sp.]
MTHSSTATLSSSQLASARALAALQHYWPGLLLSAVLAGVGMTLGGIDWLQNHGLSALTMAILLGMLVGNTAYPHLAAHCSAGVNFSKQRLLRLGIILYGLRLTLQDIGHVGLNGVLIDALVLGSTFTLSYLLGTRWLKLDPKAAMLIGAGSSICGAAAVMATQPVLRARAEHVTVAVATVVVFGTLAIFLYPVLFELNQHWQVIGGGTTGFGIYAGSTIHEVAQVVAAARSVDSATADTAVITKMVRVMMLAPFLIGLSAWLARGQIHAHELGQHTGATQHKSKITISWFAFAFIAVVVFNSFQWLPRSVVAVATEFDTVLLAMAMAALGLTTHLSSVRKAGVKPLLLAGVLFVWLVVGGALINHGVSTFL